MISTDGHRLAFFNKVLADDEDVELEKESFFHVKESWN
jgi:hypothetical protein